MLKDHSDKTIKEIKDGFALLMISEENYPEYKDPYTFADGFRICSLYSENEFVSSDTATHNK